MSNQLQTLDPETQVLVSSDAEGNEFRPLSEISTGLYDKEWGSIYDENSEVEETSLEPEEWEKLKKSKDARRVVLWPTD